MKAIRIHSHGDLNVLKIDNINIPKCKENQYLVKIKACSLNHLDIWVRKGLPGLPIKLPLIMGSDASGTIVEIGSKTSKYNIGDDVVVQPGTFNKNCETVINGKENYSKSYGIIGETCDGTQAEYIVLNEENLYLKPKHLSFEEASSMQLVFMTAYQMLSERAGLISGENVLIYGATSGVGSAAIQIAKTIGANVVSTVGNKRKMEYAYSQGSDLVLIHDNKLVDNIKMYNSDLFDVVFEHVGLATWNQSLKLLKKGGRLVTCGSTTGAIVQIDLRHLFMKQQTILGSTMSNITSFNKVLKNINKKKYKPFIDKIFSFNKIKEAHARMENRKNYGKIILVPNK